MRTERSTTLYGRRTMMSVPLQPRRQTKAHPKISRKKRLLFATYERAGGADPSIWPSSKAIRDFLNPHVGVRALGGDNRCLPVFRSVRAKPVRSAASLKLSIRFGEIFAVFRRRAEA